MHAAHVAQDAEADVSQESDDSEEAAFAYRAEDASPDTSSCALRTLPVTISNPETGKTLNTYCFLDDGNTGGLISTKAATELGLRGRSVYTILEGVGGHTTEGWRLTSEISVSPLGGGHAYRVAVKVLDNPAGSLKPTDWTQLQDNFPHLQGLDLPPPLPDRSIGLMIGNQTPHLLQSLRDVAGAEGEPVARLGLLGISVAGPKSSPRGWCGGERRQLAQDILGERQTSRHPDDRQQDRCFKGLMYSARYHR